MDSITIGNIFNGILWVLVSVLGYFFKQLAEDIKSLPVSYVPRTEIEEKDKRLDVIIAHMDTNLHEIKKDGKEAQEKTEKKFEAILKEIKELRSEITSNR